MLAPFVYHFESRIVFELGLTYRLCLVITPSLIPKALPVLTVVTRHYSDVFLLIVEFVRANYETN